MYFKRISRLHICSYSGGGTRHSVELLSEWNVNNGGGRLSKIHQDSIWKRVIELKQKLTCNHSNDQLSIVKTRDFYIVLRFILD